jgi:hypothetical protein
LGEEVEVIVGCVGDGLCLASCFAPTGTSREGEARWDLSQPAAPEGCAWRLVGERSLHPSMTRRGDGGWWGSKGLLRERH